MATDDEKLIADLEGRNEPINEDDGFDDERWLKISRSGWQQGEEWFSSVMRPRLERNIAHFKSRHEPGSKYHREEFKKRSRLFRPKTRTALRKLIAAAVRGFFSTENLAICKPTDDGNPDNVLAAHIHTWVLNHRLNNDLPWYSIVVGGLTDAATQGVVISKQYWDFQEELVEEPVTKVGDEGESYDLRKRVIHDRPNVRLVPLENIRISPAADWADPIATTPYIIEQRPYYLEDLLERMATSRVIPYRDLDENELRQGQDINAESVRAKRDDGRDRYSDQFSDREGDYDIIWVRENIVRIGNMDWYYETVGQSLMLSDPVPLGRVSRIGRAYAMGSLEIEPHTINPDGPADLSAGLQREANELINSRMDNVKLAMTGRFIVARGHQTDIKSLMRNVPGSITYSQNVNDVKDMRPQDVTRSSYEEQDRLNNDMDETLGTFSQSTVQSNRALNETVGGMNMIQEQAADVLELQIRNLTETWYQKVLRQIVELSRHHESSKRIIALAGQQYAQNLAQTFMLINQPTNVIVDVGFGNLNPTMRINKLQMGLQTMESVAPGIMQMAEQKEIAKEIFGALGYKDGSRFFPHLAGEENPKVAQLQQQIEELTQLVEGKQLEEERKERVEQMKIKANLQIEQMRAELKRYTEELKMQKEQVDQQIKQEQNEINKRQLWMQREALSHTITNAEREFDLQRLQVLSSLGLLEDPAAAMPQADVPANEELAGDLREPSSGQPFDDSDDNPVVEMSSGSDTDAGVVARGEYGNIPFIEG